MVLVHLWFHKLGLEQVNPSTAKDGVHKVAESPYNRGPKIPSEQEQRVPSFLLVGEIIQPHHEAIVPLK